MKISRLDLDGTGSPEGLVGKILKALPDLPIPVPIEELARALDIVDIDVLTTDGFEGGLITDDCKSEGVILVSRDARRGRRRFTISHELGHFLIPTHMPVRDGRFLCSREDMARWTSRENDRYARMEVEANKFASLLLLPPPKLKAYLGKLRDPNLVHVVGLANDFEVSKEAAARAYAQYKGDAIATIIVRNGTVLRSYKPVDFPKLGITDDAPVPKGSRYFHAANTGQELTEIVSNNAGIWLETSWGQKLPEVYEQILYQSGGYAMILLWVERQPRDDHEDDPEDSMTSTERLKHRKGKWIR
jgi:Zn-dependent peptidase ImmA (M78 family)